MTTLRECWGFSSSLVAPPRLVAKVRSDSGGSRIPTTKPKGREYEWWCAEDMTSGGSALANRLKALPSIQIKRFSMSDQTRQVSCSRLTFSPNIAIATDDMDSEITKLSMLTPDEVNLTESSKGSASDADTNEQVDIRTVQAKSQYDMESGLVPRTELEDSQRKCDALDRLVEKLQQDLEEAHSLIFSLQPSQPPLTDTEAARDFKTLLTTVEQWVDTKVSVSASRSWSSVVDQKGATTLLDLVTTQGRSAFLYPGTDEFNIIAVIMRFLCDEFFSTNFFGPLSGASKSFLSRIEHNMSQLDPPRDLRTRRTWHSETFTAIANGPGFRDRVEAMNRKLASDLFDILQIFITSTAPTENIIDGLYENIIKRAYTLSLKMQLSVDEYTIQWSDYYDSQPNASIVIKDPDDFELLDLQRARTVSARPPQVRIQWLFDVTPKLSVRKVLPNSYGRPKVLAKHRILVIVKEKTAMTIIKRF
uniref:Uncharacterized protein n=1 Tax=Talaromyces marneffei PM1 TaxID=1077442 RepID=A0A093V5W0_TALMA